MAFRYASFLQRRQWPIVSNFETRLVLTLRSRRFVRRCAQSVAPGKSFGRREKYAMSPQSFAHTSKRFSGCRSHGKRQTQKYVGVHPPAAVESLNCHQDGSTFLTYLVRA